MKREILFRGKSIYTKVWVYGYLTSKDCVEEVEVIPETIGQFTGLTDKNGLKIFEGDKFTYGIVEWVNGAWRFNNNNCYMVIDKHIAKHSEVIGNIHE